MATETFGQAAATGLAAIEQGSKHHTRQSNISSENYHKRAFFRHYRLWAVIFKSKDGDINEERWLVAEYYKSLSHLSEEGFERLTERLKATCTFFPTIRECLDLIKPASQYDWGHPFLNAPQMFRSKSDQVQQIAAQPKAVMIEDHSHDD